MTRSTILLLTGTLLTAGCQESRVFGDRSFRAGTVFGPNHEFPRTTVSGAKTFRDVPDADRELNARPAADRVISPPPPTRTEFTSKPREDQPSSDNPRDEVARAAESTPIEPVAPPPAPAPQPADHPVATTDKPTDKPTSSHDTDTPAAAPTAPATTPGRDPERVARASSARFPDDLKPSDDLQAAATLDRASHTLRVNNYSNKDVRGGDLWVSETYVTPVPDLAAGASITVPLNGFFDRDGRPLPSLTDTSKLQLQSAGKLYNIPLHAEELNK